MQIVIDISDKDYQLMKDGHIPFSILDKMRNGTPLPKGHGRLIDANTLAKQMIEYGWHHSDSTVHEFVEDDLPTIIEADKEE